MDAVGKDRIYVCSRTLTPEQRRVCKRGGVHIRIYVCSRTLTPEQRRVCKRGGVHIRTLDHVIAWLCLIRRNNRPILIPGSSVWSSQELHSTPSGLVTRLVTSKTCVLQCAGDEDDPLANPQAISAARAGALEIDRPRPRLVRK